MSWPSDDVTITDIVVIWHTDFQRERPWIQMSNSRRDGGKQVRVTVAGVHTLEPEVG
jgi:hypothetical protein